MNENEEIRHLSKEEQLIFMINFYKEYLIKIKSIIEQLNRELEEETKLNGNKERNLSENATCKLYWR